ncbi:hypothetical protein NQ314_008078 [Rhamnusium bicolor]|uniref:Uncharacterized protein n=1 Tax=Rhamnusium bicolor TaxID=1586634 RepID=A0AAV8YFQ1_9CUCU|nr:hypothetical protein NQ314_008078 [Rhamnusium bicolor]
MTIILTFDVRRLQNIYDDSRNVDNEMRLNNFRVRYKTLNQTRRDFERIMDQINQLSSEINPNFVPNFDALESFDELYCHIQVVAENVLVADKGEKTRTSIDACVPTRSIPRLPKLELPCFSGDMKDCQFFSNVFKV